MNARLNPEDPWPGLASFDEADSAYFRGRGTEAAELQRLVRREPLTVLFGRSGLGKTSLLKAGLFPALRAIDLLPVYVRLDHSAPAPRLAEQVLRALQAECDTHQVQAAQGAAQESLWSFFHRRDAEFWSALNRPVKPVIVLDQFEEIFTLGQLDARTRARSAEFLAELTDLVEGRPSPAVKEALERDPAAASRYEFRRASTDLVLSFREDFLAEMEGLKSAMPSIMVNRLRLLPMDGKQAHAVITEAGAALVDDEVARSILRLAWKNEPEPPVAPEEFAQIEIDPALLSVVCSELNHKRRQARPPLPRITRELLTGADREILAGFYERAVKGVDARVRAFVEDELITDRGYRDSHDWDDALALPGVAQPALEGLIAGRLLRTEERQGRRRLELAHDVLTRVVMDSRDRRRAREAEAALLAREQETHLQQQRNNRNGALVVGASILLLVLIFFAVDKAREARTASKAAAEVTARAKASEGAASLASGRAASALAEAASSAADARRQQQLAAEAITKAQEEQAKAVKAEARAKEQADLAEQATRRAEASALAASASEKRAIGLEQELLAQRARTVNLTSQNVNTRSLGSSVEAPPPSASASGQEPVLGAMTQEQWQRIMPNAPRAKLALWLAPLNRAMDEFQINTGLRRAAFLAQIAHESGELRWTEEVWGPTAPQLRYEPPSDLATRLGNVEPGDGKRFRGRGLLLITGRLNYAKYGKLLGVDLVADPDLAATPEVASRIACLAWKSNGLNELADAGQFTAVTRRLNGGTNGLNERQIYYQRAKAVFNVPD